MVVGEILNLNLSNEILSLLFLFLRKVMVMLFQLKKQHIVFTLALLSILSTISFAFVENPTDNTFSMIGTRYTLMNNVYFFLWATIYSISSYFIQRQVIEIHDNDAKTLRG